MCRNTNRSATRYVRAVTRIPAAPDAPDHAEDVAGRLDDQRRMQQVLAGIADLPARERDVVALVVWERLDYAATAAALGIPIGTVRSRLSRARARLSFPLPTPQLEEQPCLSSGPRWHTYVVESAVTTTVMRGRRHGRG